MENNELEILISTIRKEALRLDKKWISDPVNIRSLVAVEWKLTEELIEQNKSLASDIAKLVPLESENSELIASILYDASKESSISFTFFLLVRYLFSTGEIYKFDYYVDEFPIIWNPVNRRINGNSSQPFRNLTSSFPNKDI